MSDKPSEMLPPASIEHLTQVGSYRLVYSPAANDSRAYRRFLRVVLIGILIAFSVGIIVLINKGESESPRSQSFTQVVDISGVDQEYIASRIREPSLEWMRAFETVIDAAFGTEREVSQSITRLEALRPDRVKLTSEQKLLFRTHNRNGLLAFKAGKYLEAIKYFHEAFVINPSDAEVAENLGFSLYRVGNYNEARSALLHSLSYSPKRETAWGNIAGVYARTGEISKGVAAFAMNLRYAKSESRVRKIIVELYEGDSSEDLKKAAGLALARHFERKVDPILGMYLGALSNFPYPAFLPAKIEIEEGNLGQRVYIVNNNKYPLFSSPAEYSIWLASQENCGHDSCIIGHIAGVKDKTSLGNDGVEVKLFGGINGLMNKESNEKLAQVAFVRSGVKHSFSLGSAANSIALANSALELGMIPLGIFNGRSSPPPIPAKPDNSHSSREVSIPVFPSSFGENLLTSPKGITLSAEEIYAKVSSSVVVVTSFDLQGSGVVVGREIVFTNCHVAKNNSVMVAHKGKKFPALVIASNEDFDFCILKVPNLTANPAPMGPLDQVNPGQRVYTLGSPRGLELTFADGIVSAVRSIPGIPMSVIQTTAPISPGSSGGGLFDEYGRVIGITTFYRKDSQNLNFSLPVELHRHISFSDKSEVSDAKKFESIAPWLYNSGSQSQGQPTQPHSAEICNISFDVELETFGENVLVELRMGVIGSSRSIDIQRRHGGRVKFQDLCPGSYFLSIGNEDYVNVTPGRKFETDFKYSSRVTLRRGSGNVVRMNRNKL